MNKREVTEGDILQSLEDVSFQKGITPKGKVAFVLAPYNLEPDYSIGDELPLMLIIDPDSGPEIELKFEEKLPERFHLPSAMIDLDVFRDPGRGLFESVSYAVTSLLSRQASVRVSAETGIDGRRFIFRLKISGFTTETERPADIFQNFFNVNWKIIDAGWGDDDE